MKTRLDELDEEIKILQKEIKKILEGIDKDESEDDSGWWETSDGAKFGKEKLKEIEDLFNKKIC